MKAERIPDTIESRYDKFGNKIKFIDYGKQTKYGWVIDHDYPLAKGGLDEPSNWQPLHWRANLEKGAS